MVKKRRLKCRDLITDLYSINHIICHGFQKAKCQKKSSKKGEKNEKKTGIRFSVSRN